MARFFKKANGVVFQATANHDIKSLEDRFVECDKDGKEIVIEKPKKKKARRRVDNDGWSEDGS